MLYSIEQFWATLIWSILLSCCLIAIFIKMTSPQPSAICSTCSQPIADDDDSVNDSETTQGSPAPNLSSIMENMDSAESEIDPDWTPYVNQQSDQEREEDENSPPPDVSTDVVKENNNVVMRKKRKLVRRTTIRRITNAFCHLDFTLYLRKTLKKFEPRSQLSIRALAILNCFENDMFERLAVTCSRLSKIRKSNKIIVRDVEAAVKLVLPPELTKHALTYGLQAWTTYQKSVLQDKENKANPSSRSL